jgi:hypothetical protein
MVRVARLLLRLVVMAIPVVIAACYGIPYRFSRGGKVLDRQTRQGVEGISVTCLGANGESFEDHSDAQGQFVLHYDERCEVLELEDTLSGTLPEGGPSNPAGTGPQRTERYRSETIPFPDGDGDMQLEITREP